VLFRSVPDTINGWADAVHELFVSYLKEYYVEFNYSKIRPRGSKLKVSGGRAPGHMPLRRAISQLRRILNGASGRKLKPIEVYDICMFIAKAVLAGGVRRSSSICLFSPDDGEMMTAKTGEWWKHNKQRESSNNSVVLVREDVEVEQFNKIFNTMLEYGEPGFFFTDDMEYGANPCVEIGLNPRVDVTVENVERLRELGATDLEIGDRVYGWQFCNLTTLNGAKVTSREQFLEFCEAASIIGTLQASYTYVPYLSPVTQFINDREALLGVSICGIMDNPRVLLNPEVLREGAEVVKRVNAEVAEVIGINPAARTTCVKPEGTASLVLGSASGIHPHHARRYFRRVQANRVEPVYQYFKIHNPNMVEPSNQNPEMDDVICFPIEAPRDAVCLEDVGGVEFLECVRIVQENWVIPGTSDDSFSPGLTHNVSNTVSFKHEERESVRDWIWSHRHEVTGIALLMDLNVYVQAPREAVENDQQIARWNALKCVPVDYTLMYESDDNTSLSDVKTCAGGSCEWTTSL
jgi:ribonucleoside-diphosphate reductase alpha chain